MKFLRLAALGGLAYGAWKMLSGSGKPSHPAFAHGQAAQGNASKVRDAGPDAMRDKPKRKWNAVDEQIDESFPASDPPATY
jgi:hypothetical protein